jgi:hypothetical protein
MPLFSVVVREHTYTGRFYSDVVRAGSCEEALRVAAAPEPPPGLEPQHRSDVAVTGRTRTERPDTDVVQAARRKEAVPVAAAPERPPRPAPRRGFSVVVREQAFAGRVYRDVVRAGSCEEALQVAVAQAAAPEPLPGPTPRPAATGRPGCADVWIYALLHCELEAGHEPPHTAAAHGYGRPVKWARDDLGVARALPEPATDAPAPGELAMLTMCGRAAAARLDLPA